MAKQASVVFKGITIPEAYIRIERVFGGKQENTWGSVITVSYNKEEADKHNFLDQYNLSADYSVEESNPYTLLYTALSEKYPNSVDV